MAALLSDQNEGAYFFTHSEGNTWIFLKNSKGKGWHLANKDNWSREMHRFSTGGYPIGEEKVDSYAIPMEYLTNLKETEV